MFIPLKMVLIGIDPYPYVYCVDYHPRPSGFIAPPIRLVITSSRRPGRLMALQKKLQALGFSSLGWYMDIWRVYCRVYAIYAPYMDDLDDMSCEHWVFRCPSGSWWQRARRIWRPWPVDKLRPQRGFDRDLTNKLGDLTRSRQTSSEFMTPSKKRRISKGIFRLRAKMFSGSGDHRLGHFEFWGTQV